MKNKFLLPVYKKVGPVFSRGRGSFLLNAKGRRYLDLFPGWGVGILGHSHPRIVKTIKEQAKSLIFLPNNLNHQWQPLLAKEIIKNSFKGEVFFANSGAEAVEGAIKFSRLYGKGKRFEIITMGNSFHGRTCGALSATGQKKFTLPFRPLLPGFKQAKFNDFSDFKKKVNNKTIGVILELIQGEGGINVADIDYIKRLWQYCKKKDLLFIVDEIQTGMGHTGKLFCYQYYNIIPDILLLAKGLAAGVPISCMVIRSDIADIMGSGMHGSTFGGNPLAARVSLEVFRIIKDEKIILNVIKASRYLFQRLNDFKTNYGIIKEVRGKGLMAGIELNIASAPLFLEALKRGLIINATANNVLRIMPALNVTIRDLDKGLNILEGVIEDYS